MAHPQIGDDIVQRFTRGEAPFRLGPKRRPAVAPGEISRIDPRSIPASVGAKRGTSKRARHSVGSPHLLERPRERAATVATQISRIRVRGAELHDDPVGHVERADPLAPAADDTATTDVTDWPAFTLAGNLRGNVGGRIALARGLHCRAADERRGGRPGRSRRLLPPPAAMSSWLPSASHAGTMTRWNVTSPRAFPTSLFHNRDIIGAIEQLGSFYCICIAPHPTGARIGAGRFVAWGPSLRIP